MSLGIKNTVCDKCDGIESVLNKYIGRIYFVRFRRFTLLQHSLNGHGAAYGQNAGNEPDSHAHTVAVRALK